MTFDLRSYMLSLHLHYCISSGDIPADMPSDKVAAHTNGATARVHILAIIDQLRRWSEEANVVVDACIALNNLASVGSAAVKSAMRSVPDCEALLRAARASGLDVHDGRQWAAEALTKLGF